jgi:aspartate carbamoyltransferase regulatory subunit
MVTINSIKKGIVIDHITAGLGVKIFEYLKLNRADFTVALIMNAPSVKVGKKDIIKIENELHVDLTVLGLIDPNITINIIEDEIITRKIKLEIPTRVENVLICKNPRCVTSVEEYVPHVFHLVDYDNREYRCEYCDDIVRFKDI